MSEKTFDPALFLGIISGHVFFALSGISYTIAWIFNYDSVRYMSTPLAGTFFNIAVGSGLIGTMWIVYSIKSIAQNMPAGKLKIWHIITGAILFFASSWAFTEWVLHRFFTSELFLISFWAALEFSTILILTRQAWLNAFQARVSVILTGLSITVGLFCYCFHFAFRGYTRFINGLIPYGVITLTMLTICAFIIFSNNRPQTGMEK